MAPTAVYSRTPIMSLDITKPAQLPDALAAPAPNPDGPVLAIGSLATAQDGQYQAIVSALAQESDRLVEKQMLDRLVDGATTLNPSTYSAVHVVLSPAEYDHLMPSIGPVLSQLLAGLAPRGTLHLLNLPASLPSLPTELTLAGFTLLSAIPESGSIVAQRPAPAVPSSASLPLRRKTDPARKNSKKALWALSSPSAPSIDAEALLTASDRARPAACEPVSAAGGAPRRKKACKNCSCGLAELEAEEEAAARAGKVVLLDGEGGAVEVGTGVDLDGQERLRAAAASAPKATSSCGNCFLGDAFRCASCPYLGLPAFKPGEKVEIDFAMDDI